MDSAPRTNGGWGVAHGYLTPQVSPGSKPVAFRTHGPEPPPPSPTPPVSIRDTNSSEAKPITGSEARDGQRLPREVIRHTHAPRFGIRIPIPSGRKG
ncbi:hypothetical protein ZWY2020_004277 [Hordeum vulgare]|nr:hypothetical protein ZWY2020_004277 [Hordeum vulgare]